MQALGEFRSEYDTSVAQKSRTIFASQKSVSQIFEGELVDRAPDKMIDFLQGHVLLAYRNSIVYLDVSNFGIDEPELTLPKDLLQS